MYIKSLSFKNFMRIKSATLDMQDKDIIGIIGKYDHDDKRSNYVGKSSILEAIRYAITGKSRASKTQQLIHFGQDVMEIVLVLVSDDNEEFTIRRGCDVNGKSVLEVGWGDKKREGQELINDILGIDDKDFDLTFFFKQSEISQFMNLGSAEKKKMVMKWQKNDHWIDKEKAAIEDVKKLKDSIKVDEITLRNLELNLGDENTLQDQYGRTRVLISDCEAKLDNLKKELKQLNKNNTTKEAYDKAVIEYKKLSREKPVVIDRLKKIADAKKRLDDVMADYSEEDILAKRDLYKQTVKEKSDLEAERNVLTKKLEKLTKHNSGMCPIIEEPCDRIKLTDEQLASMAQAIDGISKKIVKTKQAENSILAGISVQEEKKAEIAKLNAIVSNEKEVKSQYKHFSSLDEELSKIIKSYDIEAEEKIEDINLNIEIENKNLSKLNSELSVIKHKIDEIEKNRNNIEEIRTKISSRSEVLSDLQYVAFMFGKNGIPSLEIENSFQEVEDEINFILSHIDKNITVEFKPDRELQSWEELCLSCGWKYPKGTKDHRCKVCSTPRSKKKKDELQLNVVQGHNEMSFDMCSGGLQTLVSLSVRIALTMMLKRQNNTKLNVLFLDEIDSALDEANKESIKSIVSTILVDKLGFRQVFWISHDKTISNSVPYTLLVKGYKEHSELEWM
jgi:DNA repair exonuclease SbcCD ATPase subunit